MAQDIMYGTGWRPDPPDERDYHLSHDEIRDLLRGTGVLDALTGAITALRSSVDLRKWCSPVLFQGHYNTCTAHVTAGMIELLENKAHGAYVAASRLFLYQVARRILGESGDPGVYLRQMMGTVALVGVPPEKYWPYLDTSIKDDPRLDTQPDAFLYAVAKEFGGVRYFRLDAPAVASSDGQGGDGGTAAPDDALPKMGKVPAKKAVKEKVKAKIAQKVATKVADKVPEPDTLLKIRACLSASLPSSLGFSLYRSSLVLAADDGEVPMPKQDEEPVGSHAILLVGYDDDKVIGDGKEHEKTKGAFLFKNSWSTDWGADGYGWLPYAYLTSGLAKDCWSMTQARWIDTDAFQLGLEDEDDEKGSP